VNFTPVRPRTARRTRLRVWAGVLLWLAGTIGCAVWWGWSTVWWHGLVVAPAYGTLLAAALVRRS
jgi:hypothetical protein